MNSFFIKFAINYLCHGCPRRSEVCWFFLRLRSSGETFFCLIHAAGPPSRLQPDTVAAEQS